MYASSHTASGPMELSWTEFDMVRTPADGALGVGVGGHNGRTVIGMSYEEVAQLRDFLSGVLENKWAEQVAAADALKASRNGR